MKFRDVFLFYCKVVESIAISEKYAIHMCVEEILKSPFFSTKTPILLAVTTFSWRR